jgi:hypothetical protein
MLKLTIYSCFEGEAFGVTQKLYNVMIVRCSKNH